MTTQEKRRRGRPVGSGEEVLLRMQKIVDYVGAFRKAHNNGPILREIAEGVGVGGKNFGHIQTMVQALIREGFLTAMYSESGKICGRSLDVVKKPPRKRFYP